MLLAAALLVTAQPAASCAAVTPALTTAVRRTEAQRVTRLARQAVRPSDVGYVLNEGNWRLVFATPRNAERGVFVLRRAGNVYRLIDIWGGVISPDDRGDAVAWARALPGGGVPARLAQCMEDAVVAGH